MCEQVQAFIPAAYAHRQFKPKVARLWGWFVWLCLHCANGWGLKIKICRPQSTAFLSVFGRDMATQGEMKRNFIGRKLISLLDVGCRIWMVNLGGLWIVYRQWEQLSITAQWQNLCHRGKKSCFLMPERLFPVKMFRSINKKRVFVWTYKQGNFQITAAIAVEASWSLQWCLASHLRVVLSYCEHVFVFLYCLKDNENTEEEKSLTYVNEIQFF